MAWDKRLTCYHNAPTAAHHSQPHPVSLSVHKILPGTPEKQSQPVACDHEATLPSSHALRLGHKEPAKKIIFRNHEKENMLQKQGEIKYVGSLYNSYHFKVYPHTMFNSWVQALPSFCQTTSIQGTLWFSVQETVALQEPLQGDFIVPRQKFTLQHFHFTWVIWQPSPSIYFCLPTAPSPISSFLLCSVFLPCDTLQ